MEAFNLAGHSPSSRLAKKSTLPDIDPTSLPKTADDIATANNATKTEANDVNSKDPVVSTSDLVLILVVGGALVCLVLVLVVCCSVFSCVQKSRARKRFSSANVAIHQKYTDTSRSETQHTRLKMVS